MQIEICVLFLRDERSAKACWHFHETGEKTYFFQEGAIVLHNGRIRTVTHEKQFTQMLFVQFGIR